MKNKRCPVAMDEWMKYFSKLHNAPLTTAHDQVFTNYIKTQLNTLIDADTHVDNDLFEKVITLKELKCAVDNLKLNKACGPDSIKNEMTKTSWGKLAGCMNTFVNNIITTEVLPNDWATGYIVP